MKYLSLFSGAGGGDLGCQGLLNWECLGYVEWDKDCAKIIEQRIKDGIFSDAPIFNIDIRKWLKNGYAESYKGMVDVITAGFPCQPFSLAGKMEGPNDSRNMWPETIESIRIIRPKFVLLENVPGLLPHPYGRTIFRDLAKSGYECRWDIFSAAGSGADHLRKRLWIVAHAKYEGLRTDGASNYLCNQDSPQSTLVSQNLLERATEKDAIAGSTDFPKPLLFRDVDDVAAWAHRLKSVGNGQVPSVVAKAWLVLSGQ